MTKVCNAVKPHIYGDVVGGGGFDQLLVLEQEDTLLFKKDFFLVCTKIYSCDKQPEIAAQISVHFKHSDYSYTCTCMYAEGGSFR